MSEEGCKGLATAPVPRAQARGDGMGLGLRSTPADSVASGMRQRKGRAVGPTASIWVVLDEVLPSLGFICKNDMKIIVPRSQGQ